MKRFRYRLEKVLEYRKLIKDEKVRELLFRNRKLAEDQDRLKSLEAAALLNRMEAEALLSAAEVELLGNYGARLRAEISGQEETVRSSESAVAEAVEEYVAAAKDEKSLVLHRERKQGEYREYVQHEEDKYADEMNTQRFKITKKGKE